MATYSKSSPWASTNVFNNSFLDVMVARPITKKPGDKKYKIDKVYEYKPHLLAADLYGDYRLWWVFSARNPNVLRDPLFDFRSGVDIYLPTKDTLKTDLGL